MRRVTLILLAALVTTAAILVVVWRWFGGEAVVRLELTQTLADKLKARVQIGSLSPTFTSLSLRNLRVESPSFVVNVESVGLRFRPLRVLTKGWAAPGVVAHVRVDHPQIRIVQSSPDTNVTETRRPAIKPHPLRNYAGIAAVERVVIRKGTITDSGGSVLVSEVNADIGVSTNEGLRVELTGSSPVLSGAWLRVVATGDLGTGDIFAEVTATTPDLSRLTSPIIPPGFSLSSGSAEARLEAEATDSLRWKGTLRIDSLRVERGADLQVYLLNLTADVDNLTASASAEVVVNGVPLQVTAGSPDVFSGVWRLELPPCWLELNRLNRPASVAGIGDGVILVQGGLRREPRGWQAQFVAQADSFRVSGVDLRDFVLRTSITPEGWTVDTASLTLWNGRFNLKGGPAGRERTVQWTYRREWRGRSQPWLNTGAAFSGKLRIAKSEWTGEGSGFFFDSTGAPVLSGNVTLSGGDLALYVIPPDQQGFIHLEAKPWAKSPAWHLRSVDPQRTLKALLPVGDVIEAVQPYSIDLVCDGKAGRVDFNLDFLSTTERSGGTLSGLLRLSGFTVKDAAGDLTLRLPNQGAYQGRFAAKVSTEKLDLTELTLISPSRRKVLDLQAAFVPGRVLPESFALAVDSLPAVQLLHFGAPNLWRGADGILDAHAAGSPNHLAGDFRLSLAFPTDVGFTLTGAAALDHRVASLTSLLIVDDSDRELFTASGAVDFEAKRLSQLNISVNRLPLKPLIQALAPNSAMEWGGEVNARLVADGDWRAPDLSLYAHWSGGVFGGVGGYWANLGIVTEDRFYVLDGVDLGHDLNALIKVRGYMNRDTHAYRIRLNSVDAPAHSWAQVVMGDSSLVSGRATLEAVMTGGDVPQKASGSLLITGGAIGPLAFDAATAAFTLIGLDHGRPRFDLDSLKLTFGDLSVWAAGASELNTGDLRLTVEAQGNILRLLPRLTDFFKSPVSQGTLSAEIGGNLKSPVVRAAELAIRNGSVRMGDVFRRLDDINLSIKLDSTGQVKVERFQVRAGGGTIHLSNRLPASSADAAPLSVGPYNLGIWRLQTDPVWAVIPSLMEPSWGGSFQFTGRNGQNWFEFAGPAEAPEAAGEVRVRGATITYPFLSASGEPSPFVKSLLKVLEQVRWNVKVIPEPGCRYVREISGLEDVPVLDYLKHRLSSDFFNLDVKLYLDLQLDPNPNGLEIQGAVKDTLRLSGQITSSRGTVEYLDLTFRVDKLTATFNPAETQPLLSGGATCQVMDINNTLRTVRMVVGSKRRLTGIAEPGSPIAGGVVWDDVTFILEDDQNNPPEQILAYLGYTPENLAWKLPRLGGRLVERMTPLGNWTRVVERRVGQALGLDVVEIEPTLAQNYLQSRLSPVDSAGAAETTLNYWNALDRSRVTVGKFLTPSLFVSYTGSLLSESALNVSRLGVIHDWDAVLRLWRGIPGLSLNYHYQYNTLARDYRSEIFLRYGIVFDLRLPK